MTIASIKAISIVTAAVDIFVITLIADNFAIASSLKTSVLDNFTPPLKHMSYIYYPLYFRKD